MGLSLAIAKILISPEKFWNFGFSTYRLLNNKDLGFIRQCLLKLRTPENTF
jgi:hypothetical protein